ncbi:MAG: hypothetical protein KDI79_05770 [Anaerolineae bacterium]|nr:hypothetical protein [Anaerolineae bacterium]
MKILAVISGLVGLVTLVSFFYYINPSLAGGGLATRPVVDRSPRFEPTIEIMATQNIYLPLVQKISPPLNETLKEKYLLVEHWTTEEWSSGCPGLIIDFPTYYFDTQTGDLFITVNPVLMSTNMGYMGYGTSLTGASGGINSNLARFEAAPYTVSDTTLHAVTASGQITMTHKNEAIVLLPGTNWVSPPIIDSGAMGIPECVITATHRLTNYGFQERSRIVTN